MCPKNWSFLHQKTMNILTHWNVLLILTLWKLELHLWLACSGIFLKDLLVTNDKNSLFVVVLGEPVSVFSLVFLWVFHYSSLLILHFQAAVICPWHSTLPFQILMGSTRSELSLNCFLLLSFAMSFVYYFFFNFVTNKIDHQIFPVVVVPWVLHIWERF